MRLRGHDCGQGHGTDESGFRRAPPYFARRPPPRTPDDLAGHSCIQYRLAIDGPVFDWPIIQERQGTADRGGRPTVSDAYLAARAAVDGLGIALTVEAVAEPFVRSGQLVASAAGLFGLVRRVVSLLSGATTGSGLVARAHRYHPRGAGSVPAGRLTAKSVHQGLMPARRRQPPIGSAAALPRRTLKPPS